MTHQLSQHELKACRAHARLMAVKTRGWDEAEAADAHWDAGEWSSPAWAQQWQDVEEACNIIISDYFELRSPAVVMHLVCTYENEEAHRHWLAQHLRFVVYGSMDHGDHPDDEDLTTQRIAAFSTRRKAELKCEELSNDPNNHPDLAYWFEVEDERPLNPIPHGDTPATLSNHKPVCHEYWDRGLDCPCIPEGVKDAILKGARPEEVM